MSSSRPSFTIENQSASFSKIQLQPEKLEKKHSLSSMKKLAEQIEKIYDQSDDDYLEEKAIISKIVSNHSEIHLDHVFFSNRGMEIFIEELKKNKNIESIHFSVIRCMSFDIIDGIVDFIKHNKKLKYVHLEFNSNIGFNQTFNLVNALKHCPHLSELGLSNLTFNKESMILFYDMLRTHRKLSSLYLHYNILDLDLSKLFINILNKKTNINKLSANHLNEREFEIIASLDLIPPASLVETKAKARIVKMIPILRALGMFSEPTEQTSNAIRNLIDNTFAKISVKSKL